MAYTNDVFAYYLAAPPTLTTPTPTAWTFTGDLSLIVSNISARVGVLEGLVAEMMRHKPKTRKRHKPKTRKRRQPKKGSRG